MTKREDLHVFKANTTVDDGNCYLFLQVIVGMVYILFSCKLLWLVDSWIVIYRCSIGGSCGEENNGVSCHWWWLEIGKISISSCDPIPMSYCLQSCLPVSCLHAAVLGIILWEKGAKTSTRKLVCEDVVKYTCSLCLKMKDNMHRFSTWIYSYLRLRCMKNWFQVYTCCRLVLFLIMTC